MNKNKPVIYLRGSLLALFTILITISAYLHISRGGGKSPSIHALCPFGGLESLYQVFTTGSFISKIFAGTMILFGITLVVAILFRRSFCGLICPFGAIQEFFAKIGQKVFKKKFIIPSKIDRPLRYLKYVVLIMTVFYAWKTAGLWMAPYDPWSAYAHLSKGVGSVWNESAAGLILLGITLVGSLLYDRFFCKYLCPMGAIYGIIGKISPFKVTRNENACIRCGKCSRVCPMNIDVQHTREVKSAECINCQTCVLNCPKAGALESREGKKAVKPFAVIALVTLVFFGSIFAFQLAGVYKLLPDQLKAGESIGNSDGEAKSESGKTGTKINVEAIKGSMTIKDASEIARVDLKEFYKLFKIPDNVPSDTYMRDIGNKVPGYDFHKIKQSLE